MTRSLLLLSAVVMLFASCKQLEDTTSNEDIMIGGQWKRSSLKAAARDATGTIVTTDVYASLPDCVKDNTIRFAVNYKAYEQRNGNKCSPGDPDETPVTWEFYNSGSGIRIYNALETFGTNDINATVLSLSSTQIAMRYLMVHQNPSTLVTDTTTFTDVFRR